MKKEKKPSNLGKAVAGKAETLSKKAKGAAQVIDHSAKDVAGKIKESKVAEGASHVSESVSGAAVTAAKATTDAVTKTGAKVAKKAKAATQETKESIQKVGEKGKAAQKEVLLFIDKQKNKKFFEAKRASFEDGIKQGKIETVDFIKKFTNYYLAITALSYYFARCDGNIDATEIEEINKDLGGIVKNKDLPENVFIAMQTISEKEDLSFSDVIKYLDNISNETLIGLEEDVNEIILADGILTDEEAAAKKAFIDYCNQRLEAGDE